MWRYNYNLHGLYETPTLAESLEPEGASRSRAAEVIDKARNRGRLLLTEVESKQILSYYGIPTVEREPPRTKTKRSNMHRRLVIPSC